MINTRFPILFIFIAFSILLLPKETSSSANDTYSLNQIDFCFSPLNTNVPSAHLTYNLMRVGNPNKDEISAYKLIEQVMDSAVFISNIYTKTPQKLTVHMLPQKEFGQIAEDQMGILGLVRKGLI